MSAVRHRAHAIRVPCHQALSDMTLTDLAMKHEWGLQAFRQQQKSEDGLPWLEIKRVWAEKLLASCNYCVHDCQINRNAGQTGYCGLVAEHRISGEYLHFGEEAMIGITHAIFFSGCTMHCLFCHNWRETFDLQAGSSVSVVDLVQQIVLRCAAPEVQSISFIGGTPEPHLHTLTALATALPQAVLQPWVFNSNATLSATGLTLMEGLIDLYLPDFKFGNNRCAWQLAKMGHYCESVRTNLAAYQAQGADILVRHLIMPGHIDCCTWPVLEVLARDFSDLPLNLMAQYRPFYKADEREDLNQRPSKTELHRAQMRAQELGLKLVSV
jgi:putative pyruvate formate lyase activating enzyme